MPADPRTRTLVVLWIATWCAFLCVGIPLTVLPRYVQDELGRGDVAAGVAVGALSLAAMLTRPQGGRLADEQSRRLVVTGGLAVCVLGGIGMVLFAGSYELMVGARMVTGVGQASVYAAAMAWALDLAPADRHGRAIAIFGMAIWVGSTAGTAFGELALSATGSFRVIWWSLIVVPLVALLLMALTPREAPRPRRTGPRGPLIVREAVRPGAALALSNLGYGAVAALVTLHLASRGVANPGFTLTAMAVGVVLLRIGVAWALDRRSPYVVFAVGCVLEATALVLIALAASLPVALAGGFVLGAGYAAVFPALALIAVSDAPDERRGAALGSFTAFLDLGLAVGGPLAGAGAALLGRDGAFLAAAILTLTALAVAPRDTGRPVRRAAAAPFG